MYSDILLCGQTVFAVYIVGKYSISNTVYNPLHGSVFPSKYLPTKSLLNRLPSALEVVSLCGFELSSGGSEISEMNVTR